MALDQEIRLATFDWLSGQVEIHGDVLPWALLALGFEHRGERVRLLSQQGIFKPKVMTLPLSIRTTFKGPYEDRFGADGLLEYRYQGTDPEYRDNRWLREVMRQNLPLVYFHAIAKGRYVAVWPVFLVGDQPRALTFKVAVDDAKLSMDLLKGDEAAGNIEEYDSRSRRRYVTGLVRRRLHQRTFREKVLRAYRGQCALCRLRHAELLDAAHIVPDSEERGEPVVSNGLSLCKLHHAAFDAMFLAIRPDYKVEVQSRILEESDGPMLLHGLQEFHRQKIVLPRGRGMKPDPELLGVRYERFLAAAG